MHTLNLMPQNLLGCGLPSIDPIIPPPPLPQNMTALAGLAPLAPPGEREGLQQAPLLQLPNPRGSHYLNNGLTGSRILKWVTGLKQVYVWSVTYYFSIWSSMTGKSGIQTVRGLGTSVISTATMVGYIYFVASDPKSKT